MCIELMFYAFVCCLVISIKRNIDDRITTWECHRLSSDAQQPRDLELPRTELFPLIHFAQQGVPYGVRIAKRFGQRLHFGHVVAGSPPSDTTPSYFTVLIACYIQLAYKFLYRIMPQVEFDDVDIEDMDLEEFRRCSTLANVHESDDPGLIFQRPFLYVKMSFFSQVWLAYMFYVVHHELPLNITQYM